MKSGLIVWNREEIPPVVFNRRVEQVQTVLAQKQIPALAVYSDVWRSNHARFFSNYMPCDDRAVLIIPRDAPMTLLCGLPPGVYGWIRSFTTVEDIRPAGDFATPLFELAAQRQWATLGVLALDRFPFDIHTAIGAGPLQLVNVEPSDVYRPAEDESEVEMRSTAADLVDRILCRETPKAAGMLDYDFVGALDRQFRMAGAEEVIILVTNGDGPPSRPSGALLETNFSISVAMEYRGHWIRLSRPQGSDDEIRAMTARAAADPCRRSQNAWKGEETLEGAYPYEYGIGGKIPVLHFEFQEDGKRLFLSLPIL